MILSNPITSELNIGLIIIDSCIGSPITITNGLTSITNNPIGSAILPENYLEVDYILSTGSQWLDTGFMPETTYFKCYLDFSIDSWAGGLYGCSHISATGYNMASYLSSNTILLYCGTSSSNMLSISAALNTRYKYIFTANNGTLSITNAATGALIQSKTYAGNLRQCGNYNFPLFCRREGKFYYSLYKLYACKMYTTNDVLVRDFVPCYKISTGVIGLYDILNNNFYINSGSGTFIKSTNTIHYHATFNVSKYGTWTVTLDSYTSSFIFNKLNSEGIFLE